MTQKQAKFSRDRQFREKKLVEDVEQKVFRRPSMFSSYDIERMDAEKSRAKLTRRLTSPPVDELIELPGEFSSCYYAPRRLYDPIYSATSHTVNQRGQQHKVIVPTYQSLVHNARWNSDSEPTSVYNVQMNDRRNTEPSNFTCRCNECKSKQCRGQAGGVNKPRRLRDNITRFADNATMTLILNDASCGTSTPLATCGKTSDASVSSSDVAVREHQCAMAAVSQTYFNCDPVSILKKTKVCGPDRDYEHTEYDDFCTQTQKKCRLADEFQEAVRDTEEDVYYEFINSKPMRSYPKVVRKQRDFSDDSEPRKNIYNEGISDLVVNRLPDTPPVYLERFTTSKINNPSVSRTSFVRKGTQRRDESPFAHETESRYHYGCTTPQTKTYNGFSDSIGHQTCSKKFKKTYSSKPLSYSNTESIKFPRKVLTSERDIESYIGGRFMRMSQQ